jgi:hypothetical protein
MSFDDLLGDGKNDHYGTPMSTSRLDLRRLTRCLEPDLPKVHVGQLHKGVICLAR